MMWWSHGGWGTGDWWAMGVVMVVFWGLIIVFVASLLRRGPHQSGSEKTTPSPEHAGEVLAERFARGEIDDEEFTRRRELLQVASSTAHNTDPGA